MPPLPDGLAGPALSLRDETPDDAAFAEQLFASLHAARMGAMGLPPAMIAMLTQQQYAMHRDQQRAQFPQAADWIILRADVPVGRVGLDRGPDEWRLVEIVLAPEERGRGAGAAVIRAIQDDARAAGRDVTLHVDPANPARRLYQRLGFATVWEDAASVFMRWTVSPSSRGA